MVNVYKRAIRLTTLREDFYLKDDEQSKEEHNWIISNIAPLLRQRKRSPRILDVGCGGGFLLQRLSNQYSLDELYGVDVNKIMIFSAKKRAPANLILSTAEKLPLRDSSFDAVSCQNLLHHLWRAKYAIGEMKRVLKRSGHLVIIEQCVNSKILSRIIFLYTFLLAIIGHRPMVNFLIPKEVYKTLSRPILQKKVIRDRGFLRSFIRIYIVT